MHYLFGSQVGKLYYKNREDEKEWQIILAFSHYFTKLKFIGVIVLLVLMAQSQLIGKSGEMKGVEGARKRLKISVPHFDNTSLIKQYDKTLIGRCMNPAGQDINALLVMLPKIWKVEDRVAGTDLGFGRFQFDFVEEEDIEAVLKMQPYHFDYWMIALARWQPKMPRDFPLEIPFWIKVLGVPLEFWDVATFQSIGDALGETVQVDLDYGKIKVVVDGRKELCFDTTVDFVGGEFHGGDEALISLRYEKLFGYCGTCFSLSRDQNQCPLTTKSPPKKKEIRELPLARQEDRARSYKGVVINGEGEQQVKGKDHRDYYGKGKGKIYEEQESKWVKVPERGSFRNQGYRNNQRGDDGGYRYRGDRGDRTRRYGTVENFRSARGGCDVVLVHELEERRMHGKRERFAIRITELSVLMMSSRFQYRCRVTRVR